MRKKLIGIALAGASAIAMTVTATSSQAALPCWSSFNPSAPQGAPMTHYYRNCSGGSMLVTTGFIDASGQVSARFMECRHVPANGETSWAWDSTRQGVNYQAVICNP
ncbi:hypothetical protein SK803_06025 [Lentzea sp. BCCO 10_0856]|uniref:Secreted protein n=1 Tax=Lentzea miocenica TaxID=3095431 RepID=A0ABU4SV28_9PSEU|nr:hypothetical protein [Lentzea sp. BCCO 10_0856]MDX8029759.1 hypothetical protein [Lentzea sp. BCCO 10_0856]